MSIRNKVTGDLPNITTYNADGNITGINLPTGNITGNYFIGNGSQLTGINAGGGGATYAYAVTGNTTMANVITATGQTDAVGMSWILYNSGGATATITAPQFEGYQAFPQFSGSGAITLGPGQTAEVTTSNVGNVYTISTISASSTSQQNFQVSLSASAYSVPANKVWTTLAFDTIGYDPQGAWNSTAKTYTPKQPGYYLVTAQMTIGVAGGYYGFAQIMKNGTSVCWAQELMSATEFTPVSLTTIVFMNGTTDTLSLQGTWSGPAPGLIIPGVQNTFFTASLLSVGQPTTGSQVVTKVNPAVGQAGPVSDDNLDYNTVEFDPMGYWDSTNKWWRPQIAGYYTVTCALATATANINVVASISKNGSPVASNDCVAAVNGGYSSAQVTATIYLNGTTDYIRPYGRTTGQLTTSPGIWSYFSAALIGGITDKTGSWATQALTGANTSPQNTGVTITSATSATATTLLTVNLPGAGTFEITATVAAQLAASQACMIGLYDSTGTLVPGSEVLGDYIGPATTFQGSANGNWIVHILGPATYTIRVWGPGSTTGLIMINNAAYGRTFVTWKQLTTNQLGTDLYLPGNLTVGKELSLANIQPITSANVYGNILAFNPTTGNIAYGPSPFTLPSMSLIRWTRTTSQSISAPAAVVCNVAEFTTGSDITYDSATGIVTLAAGKTYRLTGTPGIITSGGSGSTAEYGWKNLTSGANVGSLQFVTAPTGGQSYAPAPQPATYVFTPNVTTQVQFWIHAGSVTGLGSISAGLYETGYPMIDVQMIAGSAQVVGTQALWNTTISGLGNSFVTVGNSTSTATTVGSAALPTYGTYSISAVVHVGASSTQEVTIGLFDPSGTLVPNSEVCAVFAATGTNIGEVTCTPDWTVTVATASTYTVRAWNAAGTGGTVMGGNQVGRSTVTWRQLSSNNIGNDLMLPGNLVVANISASGNVTTTANLTANGYYWGNGESVFGNTNPTLGYTTSFMYASRNTTQTTGLTANNAVVFNTISNSFGGDIALNTTTGLITLKAGKTYSLTGSHGYAWGSATGAYCFSQWFNVTANTYIGSGAGMDAMQNVNNNIPPGGPATAFITPAVDTVVGLYIATSNLLTAISVGNNAAYAEVTVVSGFTPFQGLATQDYIYASRSSAQTGLNVNSDLVFDSVKAQAGISNISLNTSTGVVSLKGGVTYELTISPSFVFPTNTAWIGYQWVDATANTPLVPGVSGVSVPVTYTTNEINATDFTVVYTPPANQTIKPRITDGVPLAANVSLRGVHSSISVKQLGATAITGSFDLVGNITATNLSATGNVVASNLGLRDITKIATLGFTATLLIADKRLYCIKADMSGWADYVSARGYNDTQQQFGINECYEINFPNEDVGTIKDAGIYGDSAYALFDSGNLYTWGQNAYGQLGLGNTTDRFLPVLSKTSVAEVYNAPSTMGSDSASINKLMCRTTDGKVWATGYNGQGQFGLGNTTNYNTWTQLPWIQTNPLSVWNLGGNGGATVVQQADGSIWVAGWNPQGALGVGTTSNVTTAVNAPNWAGGDGTMRIKQIIYGGAFYTGSWNYYNNMLMLLDNGTTSRVVGCGANNWGSLGQGNTTDKNVPVAPIGITGRVVKLYGYGNAPMSCYALTSTGDVWAWGYNGFGQLGNNTTTDVSTPFKTLTGIQEMLYDYQGSYTYGHYCASPFMRKADGTWVRCGANYVGNLGDGSDTNRLVWTTLWLPKGLRIKHVGMTTAVDYSFATFIITDKNEIYACGYNGNQMFTGTSEVWVPTLYTPNALRRY